MANSAWSGNTAGLASATSPGLVGITTQTFAGKKTLDGGALIKGDTSGVAIAAGYVGEKITGTLRTLSTSIAAYVTGATSCITLNKGIYLLFVKGSWTGNNTARIIGFGVSSTASTRTVVDSIFAEGAPSSYNGALVAAQLATTTDNNILLAPPFYLNVTADSTQYYPTVYSEAQAGLNVTVNMAAIRIA
jgi:hypothetical protein